MTEEAIPSVEKYRADVPDSAKHIYDWLISENCRPSIACASTLYLFGVVKNQKVSQSVLAEHYDTTTQSISKYYQKAVSKRELWEGQFPYSAQSDVLGNLPRQKESMPAGELALDELVGRLRKTIGNDEKRLSENLSSSDFELLTGESDPLKQKQRLENNYGVEFGEEGSVSISVNKSGVKKVYEKLESDLS